MAEQGFDKWTVVSQMDGTVDNEGHLYQGNHVAHTLGVSAAIYE
jgi:hypothetical protein